MRTCLVVIVLEPFELPFEICARPEGDVIQECAANRADQTLDEGMGKRNIRHRLDLLGLENPEIGFPAMKLEQRIMIGAQ